jgi:hypothetical protein
VIAARAAARGETPPDVAAIIDTVISPIIYHILFRDRDVTPDYCRELLARLPPPRRAAA